VSKVQRCEMQIERAVARSTGRRQQGRGLTCEQNRSHARWSCVRRARSSPPERAAEALGAGRARRAAPPVGAKPLSWRRGGAQGHAVPALGERARGGKALVAPAPQRCEGLDGAGLQRGKPSSAARSGFRRREGREEGREEGRGAAFHRARLRPPAWAPGVAPADQASSPWRGCPASDPCSHPQKHRRLRVRGRREPPAGGTPGEPGGCAGRAGA
jgi:hypothetical protein